MRRLISIRLAHRLAILALSVTLPFLALIVWLVETGINSSITAAEWEVKGNAFLRPLEHLLYIIPQRYVAVKTRPSEIGAIDKEIDQAFVDLDHVADLHGGDLHFTSEDLEARDDGRLRVSLVRDRWRTLTAKDLDPEGYERIVADLQAMMSYAGDTSNLTADPDLDSAYLIDVTLRALPQLEARLGSLLREALPLPETVGLAEETPTRKRGVDLAAVKTEGLRRIDRDVRTMVVEDEKFYGLHVPLHVLVAEEWKQVAKATEAFIHLSEQNPPASAEDLIKAGKTAREVCHHFWTTSIEQVDQLLVTRMKAYERKRARIWFGAGLMVLFAGAVGWRLGEKIEAEQRGTVRAAPAPVPVETVEDPVEEPSSPDWPAWSTSRPVDRVRIDSLPPQKNE